MHTIEVVRRHAWWLSWKLAWSHVVFRILTILIIAIVVLGTVYFTGQVIRMGQRHQTLAFHYNVYVGIDDVRPWQWSLLLPLGWALLVGANLVFAYTLYRRDPEAALSLLIFALLSGVPWMAFLFYLTVVNR